MLQEPTGSEAIKYFRHHNCSIFIT